ncbi:hypothetical protein B9Z19DRAFT_1134502 [Tuber borchii]|uniref:Uncharacterized protein n=1 Tax=Tuber borchii TaxID=42251 RepID=A0A2T6ZEF2_TUBBO|nr:hypothetical protein B9Z19DRAFT_1134502 [Tuber borchii]
MSGVKEFRRLMKPDAIFNKVKEAIKTRSQEMLVFYDVDPRHFEQVEQGLRHRTNYLEQYSFRVHWNSFEKILKVIIPSTLHESPAGWILEMIQKGLVTGAIPVVWVESMEITPSPQFDNFLAPYTRSKKEGDLTFVPRVAPDYIFSGPYPSVVLESGWSEPAIQLQRDATLWLKGSGGRAVV